MAIIVKKTPAWTPGQGMTLSGTGGGLYVPAAGGGGGGGGAVYHTAPGMFGDGNLTVEVNAGDTVQFQNLSAAFNSLSSTYTSQAYMISTSDASYNAVSQIASGNVPLTLSDINFSASYGSTYSTTMGPITIYYFIATVSGVTFKIGVGVAGGGFGGGGRGGGV